MKQHSLFTTKLAVHLRNYENMGVKNEHLLILKEVEWDD